MSIGNFSVMGCIAACGMALASSAHAAEKYVTPDNAVPRGNAPGAKAQLVSDVGGHKTWALILSRDDEVLTGISRFAAQHNIKAGHFTAVGALRDVNIGWYDLQKKAYKVNAVPGQVETVSVIGDIALDKGQPVVHCHLAVGLEDGSVKGGHLLSAIVSPTLEVFVTEEPAELNKKLDQVSGLSLIDPVVAPGGK